MPGMTIRTSTNGDFHLKTPTFSKLPCKSAFGGVRGRSHLGERVAALRQAQGSLSLGLAMEARGKPPPFIIKRFYRCAPE